MDNPYYVEFTIWAEGRPVQCTYIVGTSDRMGDGVVQSIRLEKGSVEGFDDVYVQFVDILSHFPNCKLTQIKYQWRSTSA